MFTIFAEFYKHNLSMGMKKKYSKEHIHRVFTFFLGVVFSAILLSCNKIVIEPEPVLEIEMRKGYSYQLPALNNGQWVSDNPLVATVSSTGLITAVGPGKATISTYSSKGEQTIVCYLEVYLKRNILFYIATDADAGIDGDTPGKINNIRAGWKPDQGEMLIFVDRRGEGASLLHINNTLAGGHYGIDTLKVYGERNSADAAVFRHFMDTATLLYPADSYGLLFFSHASGWLPKGALNNPITPRSLVIDNGTGTRHEMEYTDFAAAIPNKKFDFIIFEACLMADVMSMYELRNKTDYVLASSAEIVAPGFTNIYQKEIMRLYDTKNRVADVVSGFGEAYYNYLKRFPETDVYCSLTLSVVKMSEMQNLATTVKAALNGKEISEKTLQTTEIQQFDRPNKLISGSPKKSRYFDLGHIIQVLATDIQYAAFHAQLEKTVIWKDHTKRFMLENYANGNPNYAEYDGFFVNRHCGMTTYIEQDAYPVLNAAYKNSSWYKAIN